MRHDAAASRRRATAKRQNGLMGVFYRERSQPCLIGRRPTRPPEVTLSFDNGPEPQVAPQVLDVLRGRGITATFFVLGPTIAEPARHALARRTHEDGHWIGNHTFSHDHPLGDCTGEAGHAEAEIGRAEALLGTLWHPDPLFRPVGGGGRIRPHLLSPEGCAHLSAQAQTVMLWSACPATGTTRKAGPSVRCGSAWPNRAPSSSCTTCRPARCATSTGSSAAFLMRVRASGRTSRTPCVPMRRGRPTGALDAITTQPAAPGNLPPSA